MSWNCQIQSQKLIIDDVECSIPSDYAKKVRANPYLSLRLSTEILEGQSLVFNHALKSVCDALQRVIDGEINRLIINIPPGYGKTLSGVWSFIARGMTINPQARFIHTSYSAELALDNSAKVKEILMSEAFQHFNPLALRDDTKAKGLWRTNEGGGMRAVQAGGGMTGFRAGQMSEGFSGAFIIDDPVKPDDAGSKTKLRVINERYNGTIASRLAHEDIPIILIMQRLVTRSGGDDLRTCGDMSEFLLRGGSGEMWDHLLLPVMINDDPYPHKIWTHGRPIKHNIPKGMLWTYKHKKEDAERLKRADKYTYSAQYMQRPIERTGQRVFDATAMGRYSVLPALTKVIITIDTANKTKESSDYTVLLCAGLGAEGKVYIMDVLRGKWKSPELIIRAGEFWDKHKRKIGMNRVGASEIYVEDAQTGTALIDHLQKKLGKIVKGITRTKDKFTRANGVMPIISEGSVMLPSSAINDVTSASWVADYITEHEEFTDNDTHDYDDQVDVTMDAIEVLKLKSINIYSGLS